MIKSFNGITSLILGLGLVGSNFYALNIASNKDSIPNIANLPNTDFSSFSIRSDKTKDGHSWAIAQNQHSPKTLLEFRDIKEEKPTFNGKVKKSDSYIHRETVAYAYRPIVQEGSKGLTAKEIKCIEKGAMGTSNGEMIGSSIGAATTPAIMQVPIIGPVASGVWFGLARKKSGKLGNSIATQWNDC